MAAKHPAGLIKVFIVGADHPALDRAHMMGKVEREVGGEAECARLFSMMRGAVRLAHVFNQWDVAPLQFSQHGIIQPVKPLAVGQEDRARILVQRCDDLPGFHGQRARIHIHENRGQAGGQHGGNVGHPRQSGHNDFAGAVQMPHRRHGNEVGGGAGVDEHAALQAQPLRPLLLKSAHIFRLRQDGIPPQKLNDGRPIFGRDVVFHQGQTQGHVDFS